MVREVTTFLFGTFVTGMFMTPIQVSQRLSALMVEEQQQVGSADLRSDYYDLEQAKRQLENDAVIMQVAVKSPRMKHGWDIERDIRADQTARR